VLRTRADAFSLSAFIACVPVSSRTDVRRDGTNVTSRRRHCVCGIRVRSALPRRHLLHVCLFNTLSLLSLRHTLAAAGCLLRAPVYRIACARHATWRDLCQPVAVCVRWFSATGLGRVVVGGGARSVLAGSSLVRYLLRWTPCHRCYACHLLLCRLHIRAYLCLPRAGWRGGRWAWRGGTAGMHRRAGDAACGRTGAPPARGARRSSSRDGSRARRRLLPWFAAQRAAFSRCRSSFRASRISRRAHRAPRRFAHRGILPLCLSSVSMAAFGGRRFVFKHSFPRAPGFAAVWVQHARL